jgi:hypothetical protein
VPASIALIVKEQAPSFIDVEPNAVSENESTVTMP